MPPREVAMNHSSCILTFDLIGEHQNKSFYVTEIVLSLVFADVIFRRERSDDQKCVCSSQAKVHSIRETFVFQTQIYTFRTFIRSLVCFPSCLRREDQKNAHIVSCFFPLFFSSREAERHAVSMVNDPFLDLFFGSEESI